MVYLFWVLYLVIGPNYNTEFITPIYIYIKGHRRISYTILLFLDIICLFFFVFLFFGGINFFANSRKKKKKGSYFFKSVIFTILSKKIIL